MAKKDSSDLEISNLLCQIENDCIAADRDKNKISKLRLQSNVRIRDSKSVITSKFEKTNDSDEFIDEDFEDEICLLKIDLDKLGDNFSLQDIIKLLPSRDSYDYLRVNYRLQCEVIKNINEIISQSMLDKDFLELIPTERKKLEFLKQAINYCEEVKKTDSVLNKIILAPTSSGNITIIDDVEHLSVDVYDDILELINSIIDGSFKRKKDFAYVNDLGGLSEVRKGDLRVIYTRISDDTYVIITAFIKKVYTDQYYRDNLSRKANNYRSIEGSLKTLLDNPDFIRQNDFQVQRLFSVLRKCDENDTTKVLRKDDVHE